MNTGIVGLGLIGGSLARTIRLHTDHRIYAIDTDPQTMREAALFHAYDGLLDENTLPECEVVLVALYPGAVIDWITQHQHLIRRDALVIDCAGVKQTVCSALQRIAHGADWHFIGGHPMAGREFSGFRYTRDDLFDKASMILTPEPGTDLAVLQRAKNFFLDLNFRRVQFTTPQTHDEMIAYTSQLAHIVSSAYVKCPLAEKHRGFSAGSFADMTRVARLNEDMWTELFFDNREALLPEVTGLIDRLTEYRDALRDGDRDAMRRLLREGREIKEHLTE